MRAAQGYASTRQAIEAGADARLITVAIDERVAVGTGVVVGLVVPAGSADAKTGVALIHHIQLGQQVDPVGDVGAGLAEVVVTVVAVGRAQHALVGAFRAHAIIVFDGIVQAHGPVFIAGLDFNGLGGGQREQGDGAGEQAALWLHGRVNAVFWHYDGSTYCYCFLRRPSFAGVARASMRYCRFGLSSRRIRASASGQGPKPEAGLRCPTAPRLTSSLPQRRASSPAAA
ncbi:hypothetical protein D9M71_256200 [compost metagenome]